MSWMIPTPETATGSTTADALSTAADDEIEGIEDVPAAFSTMLISEPIAAVSDVDAAKHKTIEWLKSERLTALIPVFEETEVVLEEIPELSEEEFNEWVNELPLGVLQKKRLRKAVAKLRTALAKAKSGKDQKESFEEHMDEAKVEDYSALPKKASVALSAAKCDSIDIRFGTEHRVEESTAFIFDTTISEGSTHPEYFKVDTDTATLSREYCGQILLTPAISKGIHSLEFCIEEITGVTFIGVVNGCSEWVLECCAFTNDGFVQVSDSIVARYQSFGVWKKGDCITLIADLSSGKLTIKAPNGKYSVDIQSLGTPLWFAFYAEEKGTSLSVVD